MDPSGGPTHHRPFATNNWKHRSYSKEGNQNALVLRLFCNPLGQHKIRADYKPVNTERHLQYSPWCCPAPGPCMTPGQLDGTGCNTSLAPAMKVGQQCRVLFQEALRLRQHLQGAFSSFAFMWLQIGAGVHASPRSSRNKVRGAESCMRDV